MCSMRKHQREEEVNNLLILNGTPYRVRTCDLRLRRAKILDFFRLPSISLNFISLFLKEFIVLNDFIQSLIISPQLDP